MPEWLTRKVGPLPAWGWAAAAGGGFIFIRWWRSRTAAASSATPTSANYNATVPDPSAYQEPTASLTTPGGFNYTGPLSGLESLIPQGALAQTSGGTAPTPVASPGMGTINLPGIGQSIVLGQIGQGGSYTGYNVTGGAPVYFGNANAVSQGAGQETAGAYAYTPISYANLVSAGPSTENLPGAH